MINIHEEYAESLIGHDKIEDDPWKIGENWPEIDPYYWRFRHFYGIELVSSDRINIKMFLLVVHKITYGCI